MEPNLKNYLKLLEETINPEEFRALGIKDNYTMLFFRNGDYKLFSKIERELKESCQITMFKDGFKNCYIPVDKPLEIAKPRAEFEHGSTTIVKIFGFPLSLYQDERLNDLYDEHDNHAIFNAVGLTNADLNGKIDEEIEAAKNAITFSILSVAHDFGTYVQKNRIPTKLIIDTQIEPWSDGIIYIPE